MSIVEKGVYMEQGRDRKYKGILLPLNFAVNPKLFKEINPIQKKDKTHQ